MALNSDVLILYIKKSNIHNLQIFFRKNINILIKNYDNNLYVYIVYYFYPFTYEKHFNVIA